MIANFINKNVYLVTKPRGGHDERKKHVEREEADVEALVECVKKLEVKKYRFVSMLCSSFLRTVTKEFPHVCKTEKPPVQT